MKLCTRKKGFAFFLCILLIFLAFPISPYAAEEDTAPSMREASATYLYHVERMHAVLSKDSTKSVGAGSTVKIMAGLLLCEALENRQTETVEITADMMLEVPSSPGYSLRLEAGDVLTVRQLLYAAICASYNDAFYLLGAYTFGSTADFLERMNQRADALSLEKTVYTDVTGINPGSLTTATELAMVAIEAYETPLYMQICSADSFRLTTDRISRLIYNRNALVSTQGGASTKYYNSYCEGMSAGSTPTDGNCVVTAAKHENETYLCIVLGGKETDGEEYGYRIANRLLDWVYKTYSYVKVISEDEDICTVPVTVSDLVSEVPVRTKESYSAYLSSSVDIEKEVTYSVRLTSPSLEAPVKEDTFVGYVAVLYDGQVLTTLPLYTTKGAERSAFMGVIKDMQNLILERSVLAGLIFFAVALIAWISVETVVSRRRRRKWDKYFSKTIQLPPDDLRRKNKK